MSDQIGQAVPVMRRSNKRVWAAKRRRGLGATDMVAALGLNPWKTPLLLWMEKTGQVQPDRLDGEYRIEKGNALEPLLIADWLKSNRGWERLAAPPLLAHPHYPMLMASLDAAVTDGERQAVLETKTGRWNPAWFDETVFEDHRLPDHYWAQVQCQLMVTGLDEGWVHADIGGRTVTRRIAHERDRTDAWADYLAGWWRRHVVEGNAPDPDPVVDYKWLGLIYPTAPDTGIDADTSLREDIVDYRAAIADRDTYTAEAEELRGRIRIAAGTASHIRIEGVKAVTIDRRGALRLTKQAPTTEGEQQ